MATTNLIQNGDIFFHSKYKLSDKVPLGTGTFATVYLIEHIKTKEKFGMKAILTNKFIKTKSEEVNILSKLNSPFIVKFVEMFQEGVMLCIVMELCEGRDLAWKIKETRNLKQKLANDTIYIWTNEMINAIYYLHKYNIIHRSVKPGHILLTKDNHVKLADFGDAVIEGDCDCLTETAGSYKYMSPEMKELIKNYSFNTDVWSTGCIIFELIVLDPYYDYQIYHKKSREEVFELPYFTETLPVLNKLLRMMLIHDQNKRANSTTLITQIKSSL